MADGDVAVERAPAKLNLALHVGPVDPDGYHPVRTLMVELDGLHDTVTVRRSAARRVDCPGLDGPANLAWRALDALEARTGVPLPLHVVIDKRIPSPAGLGGGSSDAAATLRAYGSARREFVAWLAGVGADPDEVTPAHVATYLASLDKAGAKTATILAKRAALAFHFGDPARAESPLRWNVYFQRDARDLLGRIESLF